MSTFEWGIRPGFRDYIHALDDLTVETDGVEWVESAEHWVFPGTASLLRFRAHAGALDIALRDAAVAQRDDGLYVVHGGGIALARLLGDPDRGIPHRMSFPDVALTVEGSQLFGGIYAPWARMDPVHVRA